MVSESDAAYENMETNATFFWCVVPADRMRECKKLLEYSNAICDCRSVEARMKEERMEEEHTVKVKNEIVYRCIFPVYKNLKKKSIGDGHNYFGSRQKIGFEVDSGQFESIFRFGSQHLV